LPESPGACGEDAQTFDGVIAASETDHAYPSLSAQLHARLKLRERSTALDVGSGCLALLQVLCVAQAMLMAGQAQKILVATADVHSRTLGPGRTAGEFGGLFGTARARFFLSNKPPEKGRFAYRFGEFFFGCAAQYAEAIAVSDSGGAGLEIRFDGEALSRAAVYRMEEVLSEVEKRSGISRIRWARLPRTSRIRGCGAAGQTTGSGVQRISANCGDEGEFGFFDVRGDVAIGV